jgi:hypothetical protein
MNELNRRLTSVADEVLEEMTERDYAALRDRVRATSRRMARRQVIGVALAAGVVASGAIRLVATLDGPPHSTPGADPGSPEPSSAGTSSADTSSADTRSPDAGGSAYPPETPSQAIPGTLVYLQAGPNAPMRIVTLAEGRTESYDFGVLGARDKVAVAAPDLAKVAVVRDTGELWVVERGGGRRWVASRVVIDGRHWPVWTPDASALYAMVAKTGWRLIDPGTGTASAIDDIGSSEEAGYFAWSDSGEYRAHTTQGFVLVCLRDGTRVHQISMYSQPAGAVQAVSDDGRYVATAIQRNDNARVRGATLVLDLLTGKRIPLPRLSRAIDEIFFRPGGGLLVRTANADRSRFGLHLIGLDGREQLSTLQPDGIGGIDLIAYRASQH